MSCELDVLKGHRIRDVEVRVLTRQPDLRLWIFAEVNAVLVEDVSGPIAVHLRKIVVALAAVHRLEVEDDIIATWNFITVPINRTK